MIGAAFWIKMAAAIAIIVVFYTWIIRLAIKWGAEAGERKRLAHRIVLQDAFTSGAIWANHNPGICWLDVSKEADAYANSHSAGGAQSAPRPDAGVKPGMNEK